jgi:exopolyphosphatase/pppGpp-phosphohydrolase
MNYFKLIQVLHNLRDIKDDPKYHQEESVLHHSLQSFVRARKESDDRELWVASLFHDIGKSIDNHSHEKYSLDILESFGYYNKKVFNLINNHMRIRWFLSGKIKKWGKVQEIINNPDLKELVHLRRIDAMSRKTGFDAYISSELSIKINNLMEKTNEY